MKNPIAFRLFCLLSAAGLAQAAIIPLAPQGAAGVLFAGLLSCTIAAGALVWRYAPELE